ncbi:hypothetical protein Trydic_g7920 [Trypoxylus dichotomus]
MLTAGCPIPQEKSSLVGTQAHREQNVTGEYYVAAMHFWKRLVRVRFEYRASESSESWPSLHDNASPHRIAPVREVFAKRQVYMLQHPPY